MSEDGSPPPLPEEVEIHYIKAAGFRVIHADGVWGGPTPRGYISMSFFSERTPIPKRMVYDVPKSGIIKGDAPPKETEARQGIVREVEADVMVDLETAKSFLRWLQQKVDVLESRGGEK